MITYYINLSAWIVFIELPTQVIYYAALSLTHVARFGLRLQLALMPNDPRANRR